MEIERATLTISELVQILGAKYDRMRKYISTESDEALRGSMIVAVGQKIVHLDDRVHNGDYVKILPTIAGG